MDSTGSRWRAAGWNVAALLLLAPLAAMQVTDEVVWDAADFIIFGAMLATAGGAVELAARRTANAAYRAAAAVAVVAAFLLVWLTLAVGLIGSEDNPANLLFGGVLAVAGIGALIARFRPQGLAWTLVATALAQLLAGAAALATGPGPALPWDTLLLSGFFTALWLLSAGLFHRAATA